MERDEDDMGSAERIGSIKKNLPVDIHGNKKPTIPRLDFSSITSKQEADASKI